LRATEAATFISKKLFDMVEERPKRYCDNRTVAAWEAAGRTARARARRGSGRGYLESRRANRAVSILNARRDAGVNPSLVAGGSECCPVHKIRPPR